MTSPLQIAARDIEGLSDIQLTELLKLLLHQEAVRFGIPQSAISVGLNITVGDGGEDGRIQWNGQSPPSTDFLPQRFNVFQNKATDMGPAACRAAVLKSNGTEVLPKVDEALSAGATYVLFTTQLRNERQQDESIAAMREAFTACGKTYAATADLRVYDAGKIAGWVNNYLAAIVTVLNWQGRNREGLKTWLDWGQFPDYVDYPYVPDDYRRQAIAQLRTHLTEQRRCARVVGLSGLGKTRLAYEVFNDSIFGDGMGKRVVYFDSAGIRDFHGNVTAWITAGLEGVIVVDNCELDLHNRLSQEVQRLDSKLSLLTLDYNLGRPPSGTVVVELGQMPGDCIIEMLQPVFGAQIHDLQRVVEFAHGFPQIAVLLAKARVALEPDMGNLNDDQLATRLLWGSDTRNEIEEKILEGCALFDQFGMDEEAQAEYRFIADHIVSVGYNDFYRCVQKFKARGLIDRRGRYARLVPKPLAVKLAARWWSTAPPAIQQKLVDGTMPTTLVEGFCTQITMLHFVPEAQALTATLCGPRGPFGQAEVILSEKGSRLFRAFADVNPAAASAALARVLKPMSLEQLGAIEGTTRREVVRTLERLCFHASCFVESCWSLLLLAWAENETWSNNATGYFKQFFRAFTSGTEAPPELRFQILDQALSDPRIAARALAVKAIHEMLANQHGYRTVGAEYRGGAEPLQEWRPKLWQEIFDYWDGGMNRVVHLIVAADPNRQQAKAAIADSIRLMMSYGRVDMLDKAIRAVVAADGQLWPEAVAAIRLTIQYDSAQMPAEARQRLDEWLELLQPTSIADRLALYVTNSSFELGENEEGEHIDYAVERAKVLARELAGDIPSLLPHLDALFEGEQHQANVFGRSLVEYSGQHDALIEKCIQCLRGKNRPNVQFFFGVLTGTYEANTSRWHEIVQSIGRDSELDRHYNYFLSTGRPDRGELDTSIELIRSGRQPALAVESLAYGRTLSHLSPAEISDFTSKLSEISSPAAWYALEILVFYAHGSPETLAAVREVLRTIILRTALVDGEAKALIIWHSWDKAAKYILREENNSTFSVALTERIFSAAEQDIEYGAMTHYVKPVLRELFRKFGRETWPVFANRLPQVDPIALLHMTTLLGSERLLQKTLPPVLAELPDDLLESWCMENPDFAPEFVASLTDVISVQNDQVTIAPRAKFLLDQFGDNPRVLSALGANFSSFSWAGSMVPFYERDLAAMRTIENHQSDQVRQWVGRRIQFLVEAIEHAKMRDSEQAWGIF